MVEKFKSVGLFHVLLQRNNRTSQEKDKEAPQLEKPEKLIQKNHTQQQRKDRDQRSGGGDYPRSFMAFQRAVKRPERIDVGKTRDQRRQDDSPVRNAHHPEGKKEKHQNAQDSDVERISDQSRQKKGRQVHQETRYKI